MTRPDDTLDARCHDLSAALRDLQQACIDALADTFIGRALRCLGRIGYYWYTGERW